VQLKAYNKARCMCKTYCTPWLHQNRA